MMAPPCSGFDSVGGKFVCCELHGNRCSLGNHDDRIGFAVLRQDEPFSLGLSVHVKEEKRQAEQNGKTSDGEPSAPLSRTRR